MTTARAQSSGRCRTTRQDLKRLADAWLRWAASDDGWFLIPRGEILCQVPAA
jgi:hypothetical protein